MSITKRKRIIILTALLVVFLAGVIWIIWGNTALELNIFTVHAEIPEAFEGYRIAHISDLHNAQMGDHNEKLLQMLENSKPDMIAITGDLIDSRNTDIAVALRFVEKAVQIAPCYYVTGNHEARIAAYDQLKNGLIEAGVIVLENTFTEIRHNNQTILLMGVDDPSFQTDYLLGDSEAVMQTQLQSLADHRDDFTILLSHRPELLNIYADNDMDLVLSGHAHGGQFRLPLIGGVFAPNQGLFPAYDEGIYEAEDTTMIVSRGIGNSLIPFRINNRPEVVLIELAQKD